MDINRSGQDKTLQKPAPGSVNKSIITALGKLQLSGPVSPEQLSEYRLSRSLTCFRPWAQQHKALIELAGQPDGIVFTAALANTITSYASFQKPDFPWWEKRCFPELLELGGIETGTRWRKMGLITALLDAIFKNPDFTYFEDFIVIAIHTVYSWDVKNSSMAPWAYRQLMIDIFKQYGFSVWETDDPEIREHPCNILLARTGSNICQTSIKHFDRCCMGTQ